MSSTSKKEDTTDWQKWGDGVTNPDLKKYIELLIQYNNQTKEILEDTKLQLKTALSDVEDVDYAEAVTNMKKKLLSLEAAQSSFAQISRLSLFDYIGR